jgi:hypothetical protein
MKPFAIIPIALALPLASTAHGATIIGTVTANVTSIYEDGPGSAPSGISVGSTLTLSFSYDSLALPDGTRSGHQEDPNVDEYGSGLNLSITVSSGGYNWSGEHNNGYAVVMNGGVGGANDRFEVEVRRSYGGTFNSFAGDMGGDSYLAFALSDTTLPLTLTSSLALPTSLSDLNLAAAHNNAVVISSHSLGGGSWSVTATPNLSSLVIIPEPSSSLLVLGSSSFFLLRRRRR